MRAFHATLRPHWERRDQTKSTIYRSLISRWGPRCRRQVRVTRPRKMWTYLISRLSSSGPVRLRLWHSRGWGSFVADTVIEFLLRGRPGISLRSEYLDHKDCCASVFASLPRSVLSSCQRTSWYYWLYSIPLYAMRITKSIRARINRCNSSLHSG